MGHNTHNGYLESTLHHHNLIKLQQGMLLFAQANPDSGPRIRFDHAQLCTSYGGVSLGSDAKNTKLWDMRFRSDFTMASGLTSAHVRNLILTLRQPVTPSPLPHLHLQSDRFCSRDGHAIALLSVTLHATVEHVLARRDAQ
jgi:hypothetical protein